MTIINKVSNKTLMPGITPIPDVPDAPTIGAVTDPGTDGYATVAFTPAVTGGTVTTYTATSTPGSITATSATSPVTVTGLTVSTAYTFKVKGANATATGPESAASSSFTPTSHNSYESIATVTVGSGGSSSISFSSIPSTFKHLQIRQIMLNSAANQTIFIQFNSDTGANYSRHQLLGTGAITISTGEASQTAGFIGIGAGTTSASYAGAIITDIFDYANTNKYKTVRALGGNDYNGAGQSKMCSVGWLSTSAINAITIYPDTGNFNQYSSFALYGIKG